MFQEANQPYIFGIETYVIAENIGDDDVNVIMLRNLWINHLIKEQAQFDKEDARRRPLSLELQPKIFLAD